MPKNLLLAVLLLVSALALLPSTAQAAPGDTTRVTIWRQRKLTHYGNFDTTAVLPAPGTRYRKVLMHYILGRYACAPGSQYCGSWDYTTRITLRPPAHDSLELARIITPYATDWLTRNLTHDYVVDVTEYAPLLQNNRDFRFEYQGYSWGFTVTVRLDFIEGIPPQDPIDVRNVYNGVFAYGNTANPINNRLPVRTLQAPATGTVSLKNIITGHGSDGAGCAEFCQRYYNWAVNGLAQPYQTLWRTDCGVNEVYPQTGTWVYKRGNWCPGAYVRPIWHPLTAITTPGQPFTLGISMPAYGASSPSAQFIWSSQLVTSGPINAAADASIDAIISPTTDRNYLRENPNCGGPQVRLRNLGSTRLTSATISYGVVGRSTPQNYRWTGDLAFGHDTLVVLPPLATLLVSGGGRFRTWVSSPNGSTDQNHFNDTLSTSFAGTIQLPRRPVIAMRTNASRTSGFSETSWQVIDVAGNVVAERVRAAINTTYSDTLTLTGGCYALRLTDVGCDGFAWWANAAAGNGTMSIKNANSGAVLQTISGDFGCEYVYNFRVAASPTATETGTIEPSLTVYPNPSADGRFQLDLKLGTPQNVQLRVLDALGRAVFVRQLAPAPVALPLDLHQLALGIYTLDAALANGQHVFRQLAIK